MSDCYKCIHRRSIPGDAHSMCVKPDSEVRGNLNGIRNGWFHYPINFDPIWIENECRNFEESPV